MTRPPPLHFIILRHLVLRAFLELNSRTMEKTYQTTTLQMIASSVGQDFTQTLHKALPTASYALTVKFLLLEPARVAIVPQVMIVLLEHNLATQEGIAMVARMVAR